MKVLIQFSQLLFSLSILVILHELGPFITAKISICFLIPGSHFLK